MVCRPVKNAFNIPFEQLHIGGFIANGASGKVRWSSHILDIDPNDHDKIDMADCMHGEEFVYAMTVLLHRCPKERLQGNPSRSR